MLMPAPERYIPTRVGTTHRRRRSSRRTSVHPHACGDHGDTYVDGDGADGTSPRVWGPRSPTLPYPAVSRYIPTRVGTTKPARRRATAWSVHPHACGDHAGSKPSGDANAVHPHACGDHVVAVVGCRRLARYIPTRVGTTAQQHARVSGRRYIPTRVGTTDGEARRQHRRFRYIPTRVGTTTPVSPDECAASVHPHACGDHGPGSATVRGCSVHPHACGDHARTTSGSSSPSGTSPRVWGPLALGLGVEARGRYIPTRVGTTGVVPSARSWGSGTSPRVWGPPTGPAL